jgi:type II secretory pathway pseudopilin PulG
MDTEGATETMEAMETAGAPARLADERGSMLIEMIVAMTFLTVAIGALMSLYASNVISLRRTSIEGTALTLVDRQMEAYKTLPYAMVRLNTATIPSATTDPYKTAYVADATLPTSSSQVDGGSVTTTTCAAPTTPQPECAVQYWTGPDDRPYRVDSYVKTTTPSGGRAVKTVTVVVRRMINGQPDSKIWGRAMSVIDQANPPMAG